MLHTHSDFSNEHNQFCYSFHAMIATGENVKHSRHASLDGMGLHLLFVHLYTRTARSLGRPPVGQSVLSPIVQSILRCVRRPCLRALSLIPFHYLKLRQFL